MNSRNQCAPIILIINHMTDWLTWLGCLGLVLLYHLVVLFFSSCKEISRVTLTILSEAILDHINDCNITGYGNAVGMSKALVRNINLSDPDQCQRFSLMREVMEDE